MATPLHRGTMRYRCKSCKETFDVPEGDRPRCPKCLRIHDVESVEAPSSRVSRYRGPLILFGFIAIGICAYVAWYLSQDDGSGENEENVAVEIGPLTPEKLRDHLERRRFKNSETVLPFETSEAIETFARKAAHGRASRSEKAQALLEAIRGLIDENHEVYASISPRVTPLKNPTETLAALQSSERFDPYSYELAALLVTSCRAVGVPAVLAEVYSFEAENRPADTSGTIGYYTAAIPRAGGTSYSRPELYDPVSGRSRESAAADADVLTDLEAIAANLTIKALSKAAHLGDSSEGERLASLAVRLRPSSATAHAARGTVRLLGGGGELSGQAALEEYEVALRQRPDPQRKILVARILIALGQAARSEELVRSALSDASDFGAAHGLMGLIHAAAERFDEAVAELTRAEQLSPTDPHISLLWVQYHIIRQDFESAVEAARNVVNRVPDDPQPRLTLAQVLYQDARYDEAREQFRELIRRNPRNEHLRDVLREAFEYNPDEDVADADGGPEAIAIGDGGVGTWDGGIGGGPLRLQMGEGLGKVRLGGQDGFQLRGGGGAFGGL